MLNESDMMLNDAHMLDEIFSAQRIGTAGDHLSSAASAQPTATTNNNDTANHSHQHHHESLLSANSIIYEEMDSFN